MGGTRRRRRSSGRVLLECGALQTGGEEVRQSAEEVTRWKHLPTWGGWRRRRELSG